MIFASRASTSPVAGENQWIDFRQRGIGFDERLIQAMHELARLRDGGIGHANFVGDVICLGIGQTAVRIDGDLVNLVRRMLGNLFDFHAAFGTGHQRDALRGAVDHHADVQFLADVGAFLDQQTFHQPPFRSGLVSHQGHAQDILGIVVHFLQRLGYFDAAALAAAAGVNLRLDHPDLCRRVLRAAASASATEKQGTPRGVATPYLRRSSLP